MLEVQVVILRCGFRVMKWPDQQESGKEHSCEAGHRGNLRTFIVWAASLHEVTHDFHR
jgi:hypothetical protein